MCVQEVKSLQMENESLKLTLDKVQVQLDTSLDAQVNIINKEMNIDLLPHRY
jgi:hypothetical protein